MPKDLSKIDGVFKRAHEQYQDEPSESSWQNISSALDRLGAGKPRKIQITWKRAAILLFLLLIGFSISEGIIQKSGANLRQAQEKTDRVHSVYGLDSIHSQNNEDASDDRLLQQNANENIRPGFGSAAIQEGQSVAHSTIQAQSLKESYYTRNFTTVQIRNIWRIPYIPHPTLSTNVIDVSSQSPMLNLSGKSSARQYQSKAPADPRELQSFKPSWSLSLFASNDWGFYRMDNDGYNNNSGVNNPDQRDAINSRETEEPSFSFGVLVNRQFSKRWAWRIGLSYYRGAITIDPQKVYAVTADDGSVAYKFITSSGYSFIKPGFAGAPTIGDSIQSTESQHTISIISIPLMVSYKLGKNKISIVSSLGFTGNYVAKATLQTEIKDALNRETVFVNGLQGMRKFYIGIGASVELKYRVNSKLSAIIFPKINYALSPITKRSVVETYPNSFGAGAAIEYKF